MTNQTECDPSSQSILLSERIPAIANHQTESELTCSLAEITKLLRFDYCHYLGSFSVDQQKVTLRILSTFPEAWNEKYAACNYSRLDPIVQHAQTNITPLAWGNLRDLPAEQQEFIDDARSFDIGNGVSFPIHSRNGGIGILSFANTVQRVDTDQLIARSLAEGNLVATFVHDAIRRIVNKERQALQAPLTRREVECLYWIAKGKSNWEISRILNISEHGVVYYVRKILFKFGVHSRHQAVARATAYGFL
jgi:LuxR family quorum-sensing transcriptional regulator LasR